jgi:hypothetical protein
MKGLSVCAAAAIMLAVIALAANGMEATAIAAARTLIFIVHPIE